MTELVDRLKRAERMTLEWALLENQRKALAALQEAEGCCYGDDSWCEEALALRRKMGYELYLTVKRIWDESAKEGVQGLGV